MRISPARPGLWPGRDSRRRNHHGLPFQPAPDGGDDLFVPGNRAARIIALDLPVTRVLTLLPAEWKYRCEFWGTTKIRVLGSACVSRAGDGVSPSRTFWDRGPDTRMMLVDKRVSARRRNPHARRVRSPDSRSRAFKPVRRKIWVQNSKG